MSNERPAPSSQPLVGLQTHAFPAFPGPRTAGGPGLAGSERRPQLTTIDTLQSLFSTLNRRHRAATSRWLARRRDPSTAEAHTASSRHRPQTPRPDWVSFVRTPHPRARGPTHANAGTRAIGGRDRHGGRRRTRRNPSGRDLVKHPTIEQMCDLGSKWAGEATCRREPVPLSAPRRHRSALEGETTQVRGGLGTSPEATCSSRT